MYRYIFTYFIFSLAREYGNESGQQYTDNLKRVQTVIIDISTAISKRNTAKLEFSAIYTKELEDWIDEYSKQLPPPEQYIIPVCYSRFCEYQ